MDQYFHLPFQKLIDQADKESHISRCDYYNKQIYRENSKPNR